MHALKNLTTKSWMLFFTLTLCTAASSIHAIIIDNREWVQVSATAGFSSQQIAAQFNRVTGECALATCQIGGLDLTDHYWADNGDVVAMVTSFGVPALTSLNTANSQILSDTALDPVLALFNPLQTLVNGTGIVRGLTRNQSQGTGFGDYVYIADAPTGIGRQDAYSIATFAQETRSTPLIGGFFYRAAPSVQSVAAPPAIWLALLGTGMLLLRRRAAA